MVNSTWGLSGSTFLVLLTSFMAGPAIGAPVDNLVTPEDLRGKWQGTALCGKRFPITLDIDKVAPKGDRLTFSGKAFGGDGNSLKIESNIFGSYDPANGLFQANASPPAPTGDQCDGTRILGTCFKSSGVLADVLKGSPEKQRQERIQLMANSSFELILERDDKVAALSGTARGSAFDCNDFQLTRADRDLPSAFPPASRETEQAALDYLNGLRFGGNPPPRFAETRVFWMERLSRGGDAISTAELGRMYEMGQPPFVRNLQTATNYYRRAAEGGESRAQVRLSRLLALGQEGVPQDLTESERWAAAAKATSISVSRYCLTPPMIAAYRDLLEALKNDPGMRMLSIFGTAITGLEFDEGTFRIEGGWAEAVSTPDGPFLCRIVGHTIGASVRNVRPQYTYAGEDNEGRSLYYDQSGDVAANELIAAMMNSTANHVQTTAAFAVRPLGGNRFRVRIVQEQINTGNVYATEVQIGPDMLALVRSDPLQRQTAASPARSAARDPGVQIAPPRNDPGRAPAKANTPDPVRERSVWSLCQSATTAAMCQAYLQDYPNGAFVGEARHRLTELSPGADQASAPPISSTAAPSDMELNRLIDVGFQRWGRRWAIDRYIGGSAGLAQRECNGDTCQVRGKFNFMRFTSQLSIPFSALLARRNGSDFSLARLCYADPTSARQDCADF